MTQIILFEDNDLVAEDLMDVLGQRVPSASVRRFASLHDALRDMDTYQSARQDPRTVWIVDLLLRPPKRGETPSPGDCDGLTLIRDLCTYRAAWAERILVVTYYSHSEVRQRLRDLRIPERAVLPKGLDVQENLLREVERLMATRAGRA